jgi:hypothetical protein
MDFEAKMPPRPPRLLLTLLQLLLLNGPMGVSGFGKYLQTRTPSDDDSHRLDEDSGTAKVGGRQQQLQTFF